MKSSSQICCSAWAQGEGQLQLGLVVVPKPGCLREAKQALSAYPGIELGTSAGHKLPATAVVNFSQDEALLQEIGAMPAILQVQVVFAQMLPKESM